MEVQIWEHLNEQAKQRWTQPDQAVKFVAGMLKIREEEQIQEELDRPFEEEE